MTPAEAAALLTVAAAFDNRKPDADQARAWAMALDGLRFEDCREAIVQHYRQSREWLMPVEVIAAVKKLRNGRVIAYGLLPDPPAHIDPDDTRAIQQWRVDLNRAIADGEITNAEPIEPLALTREQAKERMNEIRGELAKRKPAPERIRADVRAACAPREES